MLFFLNYLKHFSIEIYNSYFFNSIEVCNSTSLSKIIFFNFLVLGFYVISLVLIACYVIFYGFLLVYMFYPFIIRIKVFTYYFNKISLTIWILILFFLILDIDYFFMFQLRFFLKIVLLFVICINCILYIRIFFFVYFRFNRAILSFTVHSNSSKWKNFSLLVKKIFIYFLICILNYLITILPLKIFLFLIVFLMLFFTLIWLFLSEHIKRISDIEIVRRKKKLPKKKFNKKFFSNNFKRFFHSSRRLKTEVEESFNKCFKIMSSYIHNLGNPEDLDVHLEDTNNVYVKAFTEQCPLHYLEFLIHRAKINKMTVFLGNDGEFIRKGHNMDAEEWSLLMHMDMKKAIIFHEKFQLFSKENFRREIQFENKNYTRINLIIETAFQKNKASIRALGNNGFYFLNNKPKIVTAVGVAVTGLSAVGLNIGMDVGFNDLNTTPIEGFLEPLEPLEPLENLNIIENAKKFLKASMQVDIKRIKYTGE